MVLYINILGIYFLLLDVQGFLVQFADEDALDSPEVPVTLRLIEEKGRDIWGGHLKDLLTFRVYDNRDNSSFDLHLKHNRNLNISRPVYVMRNGRIIPREVPSIKRVEYYQDTDGCAAVGITCDLVHRERKQIQLEGFLKKGNDSCMIYPDRESSSTRDNDGFYRHVIRKINVTEDYRSDYIQTENVNTLPRSSPKRVKRQGAGAYSVELLMVVDYSAYLYWFSRTHASTESARHNLALQAVQQYYAFILNGIDLRYSNIPHSDFSINVLFSGLFIADNSSVSTWTENITSPNSDKPSRPYMDSGDALDAFTLWLQSRSDLPAYDHAMVFTANDLTSSGETSNSGLAFVSGICTTQSTSISEIYFNFQGLIIAAHELGHNLGSRHDGDGNLCTSSDQYIMSSTSGGSSGATALNPWYFSICSVDYFRAKMEQLNTAGSNCLVTEDPSYDPNALDPYLVTRPGQFYSGDDQCTYSMGNASAVCRLNYEGVAYREVCAGLYCYVPGSPTSCSRIFPSRGTSCGEHMWCEDGECKVDLAAPPVLDSCPFGDQPGIIVGNLTCADIADQEPERCYAYYRACCVSCHAIETGEPDCMYGDKHSACKTIERNQCYANEETCCGTCAAWYNPYAESGCEYGDLWSDCLSSQCQYYSQTVRGYCCETCCDQCTTLPSTTTTTTTTTTMPNTTTTSVATNVTGYDNSSSPSTDGATPTTTVQTTTCRDYRPSSSKRLHRYPLEHMTHILMGLASAWIYPVILH